jgi:hypothetical protein
MAFGRPSPCSPCSLLASHRRDTAAKNTRIYRSIFRTIEDNTVRLEQWQPICWAPDHTMDVPGADPSTRCFPIVRSCSRALLTVALSKSAEASPEPGVALRETRGFVVEFAQILTMVFIDLPVTLLRLPLSL